MLFTVNETYSKNGFTSFQGRPRVFNTPLQGTYVLCCNETKSSKYVRFITIAMFRNGFLLLMNVPVSRCVFMPDRYSVHILSNPGHAFVSIMDQ